MSRNTLASLLAVFIVASPARSATLTADDAVKVALQHSSQIVQASANVLDARSGLWGAYSGVLPRVSAGASRNGSFTGETNGNRVFGNVAVPSSNFNAESYSGSYDLSGTWSVFNLSSLSSLSSARSSIRSAKLSQAATRQQVVLDTRVRFYEVVKAMHLSVVSSQALKLARDNERRVHALYDVGSVSKSDLLKARVNTSQGQVDSLVANHNVIGQRILLAEQMGIMESALGEVDSTLNVSTLVVDPDQVLADARTSRPDVKAADADLKAAELGLRAANWARLPYVTVGGSYTPVSRSQSKFYTDFAPHDTALASSSESKRTWSGNVALNLDLFTGFATEGRIASARARIARSRETRDALVRNLESEVHQAMLGYQEAVERQALSRTAVESASENLNLVQQKYNVGSATILDLIDSQVQLQRAQSDLVSALANIREAEAKLEQVRGHGE